MPLLFLAACSNSGYKNDYSKSAAAPASESMSKADSTPAIAMAPAPLNAPERKVIHTADFHCKVKNVFTAVTTLENLVKSVGGVVQESHMDNSGYDTRTAYYKPDSLRQTQTYTTTATLTLRIPSSAIDSVIGEIPSMTCFIDSRTLRQSDVTYRLLSNELKNQVGNPQNTSARALALARKSKEPIEVQEYEDGKQEQKIGRKIENLSIMDDVNYATLTVAFSQPEQVFVQTIVNPGYFTHTPLLLQCKAALANGWDAVIAFAIGIINIWPLMLILFAVLIIYRRIRHRRLAIHQ